MIYFSSMPNAHHPTDIFVAGMSRSGTTLLVTILDSHPDVSMGYELLPAGLGGFNEAAAKIRSAGSNDATAVAQQLKAEGSNSLATFVKRAPRTLVEPADLAVILEQIATKNLDPDSFEARILLSRAVTQHKQRSQSTQCSGFKLNAPSIAAFDRVLLSEDTQPGYVFITRDPRDIVASHIEHDFNRTIEHICTAWKQYLSNFLAFQEAHPDRPCMLIRYEDLVCEPDTTINTMLQTLGLDPSEDARKFYEGKASVHSRGHRNKADLAQDVYTKKLARWTTDLTPEQILEIQSHCGELMERMNYFSVNPSRPFHEPDKTVKGKMVQMTHKRKKKFFRDQYAELIDPLVKGRVNLTWAEACRHEYPDSEQVVILRHDVDHDLETALQMARWEHQRGLRATYCILHTAWYYGRFTQGVQERSKLMLEGCRELQDLGHEINIHNNFIVQALKHKIDASRMLLDEIAFFRTQGTNIEGTSTHGDGLCRELDFRNFELFKGRAYPSRGGARTITHDGCDHPVGALPVELFGLDYEAYDIPRDTYVSDSGGNLRVRRNTRGMGSLRRKQMDNPPPYHVLGILTHPIWWDMTQDAPADSPLVGLEDLVESDYLEGDLVTGAATP